MVKYKLNTQYPLLLFIVDGDDDDDLNLLNNNNKGRLGRISSGARSIMTQWSNYNNTCWLTTVISIIILFLLTIMILTIINTQIALQLTKCHQLDIHKNQTIYLVHNYDEWDDGQMGFFNKIVEHYPNYQINIIEIGKNHQSINFTTTINDKVIIKRLKYKQIINDTPLYWGWSNLSTNIKNFLMRVVEVWKYGGLSFHFNLATNSTRNIDEILIEIRENYENLNNNQTIIDKNGLYFGSRIPCHIVYGRILMLTKHLAHFNIDDLLKQTMIEFCNSHIIANNYYCNH